MIDDDDDVLLSPERLARYDVPGAPAGFSARVMAQLAAAEATSPGQPSRQPRRGWRPRVWQALAVAAIVLVIAGMFALRGGGAPDATGSRVTVARETITLGTRGVAVAETGSELTWTVHAGEAVIEQTSGTVFYRVEHGGPFEVRTPLGVVKVTGTCFSVEVTAMKNPLKSDTMKGAVMGAAIATAVVVMVYEGGVSLANPIGQLHVAAGETAVVEPGAAPRARGTTTAALDPQARALADAQARIRALEDQVRQTHVDDAPKPQSDPGRFYAPSADTLRDMAENCWVAFDQPPWGTEQAPELVDGELATVTGVTDAERDAINQAYRKLHDRELDAVRRLYVELTGADGDAAAALSLDALMDEIGAKSPPDDEIAARRHVSRERAGLDPAPSAAELAHRPAIERLLRIKASLGNEAEAVAAGVVGAKRARDLRAHEGIGWRHTVSDYGGCERHF